jgi:hypothetical protein
VKTEKEGAIKNQTEKGETAIKKLKTKKKIEKTNIKRQ